MYECKLGLYEKAMPTGLSFPQMLEGAREAGFDFLELSVDETDARLARLTWTGAERARVVRAMEDANLPIRTMCLSGHRKYPLGSRDAKTRARGLEIMEGAVRLADDLGIRIIQLAGYDVYYEEGGDDTEKFFRENLAKCCEIAAARGVLMGFETMETPFMDTVSKAMKYVRLMDCPYLGVYPDLGNLTNAAKVYGSDLYADIECGRGHLVAMHVKETVPGKYRDLRFGKGHVDFERGIEKAKALGVRRFVSECWHDGREDWMGGLKDVSRFIRAYL